MRELKLTQGQVALVDDADYDYLNQWKWSLKYGESKKFYAARSVKKNGVSICISMHRELLRAGIGQQIDHCNGNGLDNRRENLRFCTGSQNQANRGKQKNCKSGFKGVVWDNAHRKWKASIQVNYKRHFLGGHNSKEEAARVYDVAAKKYFGDFARLNYYGTPIRDDAVA